MNSSDEYVMDALVTFEKVSLFKKCSRHSQMPLIVYDLLLTEVWKEKVYTNIKDKIPAQNSIKQYMAVS
jgi:hypothetical protein